METIDQPPADTGTVPGWIGKLPTKFPDVNGGVMEEMISLTLRYFKEVSKAAGPYQDAPSVLEMLELQRRFSLWQDGVSGLDQKLENNPAVRVFIVSDLAGLVLILSTGIRLFTNECQQILFDKTNRVLEQASKIALSHLKHPASCPPLDILRFCNSTKEIKSRIDNLYDLLPTIQHMVENFDETEPRQAEEIGVDKGWSVENFDETEPRQAEEIGVDEGWSFSNTHIKRVRRRISQAFEQLRSTITPATQFSSTSHGAKNSRKPHSNPSKSSTKKSYRSTDPSSISTIRKDSGTYDSANPLTDTVTSDSLSEVERSSSKPITSISTRASSNCKKCRTTFSDPAGIENHPCPGYSMAYLRDRFVPRLSARKSHGIALDPDEFVRIWHQNGRDYKKFRIALIDSGADVNLIRRSIVEELELEITRVSPTTLAAFDNHVFSVSERVQPKWQFYKGSWRYQQFPFSVVSEIPGDRDMVLGNIARRELGIEFWASGALVAQKDPQDPSTRAQQQELHEIQRRDNSASQAKTWRDLVAKRAQMARERAAADAATRMRQSNSRSQQDPTRSGNSQG